MLEPEQSKQALPVSISCNHSELDAGIMSSLGLLTAGYPGHPLLFTNRDSTAPTTHPSWTHSFAELPAKPSVSSRAAFFPWPASARPFLFYDGLATRTHQGTSYETSFISTLINCSLELTGDSECLFIASDDPEIEPSNAGREFSFSWNTDSGRLSAVLCHLLTRTVEHPSVVLV
jgi:hypothetical protein